MTVLPRCGLTTGLLSLCSQYCPAVPSTAPPTTWVTRSRAASCCLRQEALEGGGLWLSRFEPSQCSFQGEVWGEDTLAHPLGCPVMSHTHTFQGHKLIFRNSRVKIHFFHTQQNFRAASSQEGDISMDIFMQCHFPLFVLSLPLGTYHCIRNGVHCRAIYLSVDNLKFTKTWKEH